MDFNKYLLENLLDCYEKYCSFAREMSDEDIDAMYLMELMWRGGETT